MEHENKELKKLDALLPLKTGFLKLKNGLFFGEYDWKRCPHGSGVMLFDNGSIYVGHFKECLFDGAGLFLFSNGACASGTFRKGSFDGQCCLRLGNGDLLIGWFQEGRRHGVCVHYTVSKNLKAYRRYKKGILESVIKLEVGEIKEDDLYEYFNLESFDLAPIVERSDILLFEAKENSVFIGTRAKNFGIMLLDGDVFEYGLFRRGKLEGFGVRTSVDGKIEGHFQEGLLHGIAFSYVASERFGLLAEYKNDSISQIIQKTTKMSQKKVDLLGEFLKKSKHIKPIQSGKEVNSQFAIFDESETQYIKTSMKFVTFPFFLEQRLVDDTKRSVMAVYLFNPSLHKGSPVQVKDLGWDTKEMKSAKLLNSFPKTCETIVEEPTLEIQETDYDYNPRDSSESTANIRSLNEIKDNSKLGSNQKMNGESNQSSPRVKDIVNDSAADDDAKLRMKKSVVQVEGNSAETLPPAPFLPKSQLGDQVNAKSVEILEQITTGARSDRVGTHTRKLVPTDSERAFKEAKSTAFQSTLNQLRSLRQKYSKSANKNLGRSISPKTMEVVKKQLKSALRSRGESEFDSESNDPAKGSPASNPELKSETTAEHRKTYKSQSVNLRKPPAILPALATTVEDQPAQVIEAGVMASPEFSKVVGSKGDKESRSKTAVSEADSLSLGESPTTNIMIDAYRGGSQVISSILPLPNPKPGNIFLQGSLPSTLGKNSRTETLKSSEARLHNKDSKEDTISIATLQRIFCNSSTNKAQATNVLRQEMSSSGLFKKIPSKKTELNKKGGFDSGDPPQGSSLLLSQMLDKVAKSRSSNFKNRAEDNSNYIGEPAQNIKMIFNNLFVDGIANISLGEFDQVSKKSTGDPNIASKDLIKRGADSEKPSQRKLIADLVANSKTVVSNPAKTKDKKSNSQQIESSKSSADKSIRSSAQNSCDTNKSSFLKTRKNTIGTAADLLNATKSRQKSKVSPSIQSPSITIRSEKNLKVPQGQLDLSYDHSLNNYQVPVKNSKFSTQIYPGGSHPKTVLLEDTDKSCAAIRQKVKDLLDPRSKALAEAPTHPSKRAISGSAYPVMSHKMGKSIHSRDPAAQ